MSTALPFCDSETWRWRWLHLPWGKVLHRVAHVRFLDDEGEIGPVAVYGRTRCGREGVLLMPGFVGRMEGARCGRCCTLLGVDPKGAGNPFNETNHDGSWA